MKNTAPVARKPKILLYDLETSHNIVATFRLFGEDYIPHQNLLHERFVICASWKILGEKKVHSVSLADNPKLFKTDSYNDKHVIETLHNALSEADVIVAHNGDKYDSKFFKTRAIYHALPPLPPVKSVDTLKVAKQQFLFNSNRLDYLGKYLGVGRKIETTPGLWLQILMGDEKTKHKAIKDMVAYNVQDVLLLEDVFVKLQPYVANLNFPLYDPYAGCPKCGSTHYQSRGEHVAETRVYQRFQCQNRQCMGWFRREKPTRSTTTRAL